MFLAHRADAWSPPDPRAVLPVGLAATLAFAPHSAVAQAKHSLSWAALAASPPPSSSH